MFRAATVKPYPPCGPPPPAANYSRISSRLRRVLRPYHALDTRQIGHPHARQASSRAHQRFDRLRLSRANFKYYFTIAPEPSRKPCGDLPVEIDPVAAARKRDTRLEAAHLGGQCGKLRLG